ncbi:hypothetical protein M153_1100076806, partial [Pseudoloma neurophilia]
MNKSERPPIVQQTNKSEDDFITIIDSLKESDPFIVYNALQSLIDLLKDYNNFKSIKMYNRILYEIYNQYETNISDKNIKQVINMIKEGKKITNELKHTECMLILSDILSVINNDILYRKGIIPLKEWGHQYVKEMMKQLISILQRKDFSSHEKLNEKLIVKNKTTEQGKTSEQGDSVHKQESERLAMSAVSMIDTLYDR